jgi:hypothetical protein
MPALCVAGSNGTAVERPVVAQTLADFDKQSAAVRVGMEADGVYGYIKDDDKHRVEQRLDEMHRILQRNSAQPELPKSDRIALLNAQEELNALLLQNDNNRLECENGTRTGSRIHVTSCHTHGELMQRQRQDQGTLDDIQRQPQTQQQAKEH